MLNRLSEYFDKNPIHRFVLVFLSTYIFLDYFSVFYMGITSPGNYYSNFLDNHLNYVRGLRHFLISSTASILQHWGYNVTTTDTMLHAYNVGGFNIVYSCLGFGLMSFFLAFVIAYPKPLKSKLIFGLVGLITIQILNILRLLLITLYWTKSVFAGRINHHTLFNVLLYIILLFTIIIWVNWRDKTPGTRQ
ncbi:MAG: hypothetical protein JWN56_1441 [Sphingobacteriales bacterium]|nr:hypothetical protein [Sphingobacteriales bacterium]